MSFEYEVNPKPENEILADKINEKLGLAVRINLNPLDGKVHILSEEEISAENLDKIKDILREAGRA